MRLFFDGSFLLAVPNGLQIRISSGSWEVETRGDLSETMSDTEDAALFQRAKNRQTIVPGQISGLMAAQLRGQNCIDDLADILDESGGLGAADRLACKL